MGLLPAYKFIIQLIGQTKTKKELEIKTEIDEKEYTIGKEISKNQMKLVNLKHVIFMGNGIIKLNQINIKNV